MEVALLGPLSVTVAEGKVSVGSAKERAVLSLLALRGANGCPAAELVAGLWGDRAPRSAAKTLQTYVSKLRQVLPAGVISTTSNGYVLVVASDAVDVARFETAVAAGRDLVGAGDRAGAVVAFAGGLRLWRGRALVDLVDQPAGMADAARLEELRRSIEEELAELRLALGQHQAMVGDLEAAVAAEPLRERRWVQLMLALYRSGRHADALRAFQRLRRILADELGLAPSVETRAVEAAILAQDAGLSLGVGGGDLGQPVDTGAPTGNGAFLFAGVDGSGASAQLEELHLGAVEELALAPGPDLPQLEFAILARDSSLGLPAPGEVPVTIEAGRTGPAAAPVRRYRGRSVLAVGALLLALLLVGVVVESSGGRAPPMVIPGDAVGAISPSGGAIRAVVPLGASPSTVTGGDGAVWVANYNQDTVSRVDPVTRSVVQTIQTGTTPSGIAIGAGAVWVTNNYGQTVSRIDPTVNRVVQTIPVGDAPVGVAVGYGSVWVANSTDGTLTRIDAVTGAVTDTITLGGAGATDVAVGGGAVWVSDEAGDRVLRVDPQADQVTATINVGAGPTAISSGFGSVWVTNSLDGTISRLDPATGAVNTTIEVGNGAGAVAMGGGSVWVSNQYAGTVSRIDPLKDRVTRTVAVGNLPQGLALAGGLIWVGSQGAATSHRGGTLTVEVQFWVTSVDPVFSNGIPGLDFTNDGLTAYQRVGGSGSVQVVPDLAVSLPTASDGGTTYTFQLRRGIRYSDGEVVRPEDFRYAVERDLTFGPSVNPFVDVVGAAGCAAQPRLCDLSRGVVVDDATDTVTFHLVAPDPEFLARLSWQDAEAVPPGTPNHDVGLHPIPATGPYELASVTPSEGVLVRNRYFHEWSQAARPDGYPDRIVFRRISNAQAEITDVERGIADYEYDGVPLNRISEVQTRFASQLYVNPVIGTDALVLNTRVAPFTDLRVRQAINYAIDRGELAGLLGQGTRPACQLLSPGLPGYQRYCPYTLDPNPAGVWQAPDLAKAKRLVAASHTRGTPITIWDLGPFQTDYTPAYNYLASVLDQLGYPTRVIDFANGARAQFADSRTKAQAAISEFGASYPSASQMIQVNFACHSFVPGSSQNANPSEFCDPRLDAQINSALAAESNHSPAAAALWAQADRTVTDQAPLVPLTTPSQTDFVSARVGDYQYNFTQGALLDQLWVR